MPCAQPTKYYKKRNDPICSRQKTEVLQNACPLPRKESPLPLAAVPRTETPDLLTLQPALVHGERLLKQLLLFPDVHGLDTSSHRGAWRTTRVEHVAAVVVLRLVQQRLDTRLHEAPGSRVQRLLLSPHDVLGVRVAVDVLLELSPWERVELLNTGDGRVADALGLTVLHQRGVHLTGADDQALDLLRLVDGSVLVGRVGDDPLEVRVASELVKRRACNRVTQQRFREEDNQGWCTD